MISEHGKQHLLCIVQSFMSVMFPLGQPVSVIRGVAHFVKKTWSNIIQCLNRLRILRILDLVVKKFDSIRHDVTSKFRDAQKQGVKTRSVSNKSSNIRKNMSSFHEAFCTELKFSAKACEQIN